MLSTARTPLRCYTRALAPTARIAPTPHLVEVVRAQFSPFQAQFNSAFKTSLATTTIRDAILRTRGRIPQIPSTTEVFGTSMRVPKPYSPVLIWAILGINTLVFFVWVFAEYQTKVTGDASLHQFMRRNFQHGIGYPLYTLITSSISHSDPMHFLFNMLSFWFMAPTALLVLGNTGFISLYLVGGVLSAAATSGWDAIQHRRKTACMGASGAVYSIVGLSTIIAPTRTFMLYGIIPMPAWLFVGALLSYSVYQVQNDSQDETAHTGHIAGLVTGFVWLPLWVMKKRFTRR